MAVARVLLLGVLALALASSSSGLKKGRWFDRIIIIQVSEPGGGGDGCDEGSDLIGKKKKQPAHFFSPPLV
jgi:hypothetical protein